MTKLMNTLTTCFAAYSAGALFGYFTGSYTVEAYTETVYEMSKFVFTLTGIIVLGLLAIHHEEQED